MAQAHALAKGRPAMPLLYEKHGAVAVLTLSRPQARNAWGEDYNAALKELLPQIEDDPAIRVVILTGDEAGVRSAPAPTSRTRRPTPAIRSPMRSRHCRSGGAFRR